LVTTTLLSDKKEGMLSCTEEIIIITITITTTTTTTTIIIIIIIITIIIMQKSILAIYPKAQKCFNTILCRGLCQTAYSGACSRNKITWYACYISIIYYLLAFDSRSEKG